MLKNVVRVTLASAAASQLEQMIQEGAWPEGTKIPAEPELADQLGVGRNTVREAVRALTYLGLLEARPGDGTYVLSTSVLGASIHKRLETSHLLETLEARRGLELEAARLAARRRSDADVDALRAGLAAIHRAFEAGEELDALTRLAFEQQLRLVRASGNSLLGDFYESMADAVHDSIATLIGSYLDQDIDIECPRGLHDDLVEAIAARDEAAATHSVIEQYRWIFGLHSPPEPVPGRDMTRDHTMETA